MAAPIKNPSSDFPKILSSFFYKAIFLAILIALLPLFLPQTPEDTKPTFLSQTWEILHLLLVGIAISYGLFSRRIAAADLDSDKEKEAAFKSDTNSYISRILQISPFFDDEESKAETWSSRYHRPDPVIVETKPLLLPVRSLKNSNAVLSTEESFAVEDAFPSSSFFKKESSFSPPPPPPPPPPSFNHGTLLSASRESEAKMSYKSELEDLRSKEGDGVPKNSSLQQKNKKIEFLEKMTVMSDDSDAGSVDSDTEESVSSAAEVKAEAEENEVDKKADEFIAKFREQIRLQRVASIKKSTVHRAVKNAM